MRRLLVIAGVSCVLGCVQDPDGGAADDGVADGALVDATIGDAAVEPEPLPPIADVPRDDRFANAWLHPSCTAEGRPAAILSLGPHGQCDLAPEVPDRLQIYVDGAVGAPFPAQGPVELQVAPGTPVRGLYFDIQGRAHQVSGTLLIERVDVHGQSFGQFTLESAAGHALEGAFAADFCLDDPDSELRIADCFPYGPGGPPIAPEPDVMEPDVGEPEPQPEPMQPPVPDVEPGEHCEGHYTVTQWAMIEANFHLHYINDMLSRGLIGGSVVLDVLAHADRVELIDVTVDAAGIRRRSPEVPPYAPIPIEWDAEGFVTTAEGAFGVWLSESEYPRFEPLVWDLEAVHLEATAAPDCASLSITQTGFFRDQDFTIPGNKDVDADGDGVMDSWSFTTQMTAERL